MRKNRLFHNWGIKILSFLLACLLWFYVQREILSIRSFPEVPIKLINFPSHLYLISQSVRHVQLEIKGKTGLLNQLKPEKIKAVLDLEYATPGVKVYHLTRANFNIPPEIEIVKIEPKKVVVELRKRVEY